MDNFLDYAERMYDVRMQMFGYVMMTYQIHFALSVLIRFFAVRSQIVPEFF